MENLEEKIARLEAKIDAVYVSSEKVRKYLLVILVVTVIMFVLPFLLGGLMLPFLMDTVGGMYSI